MRVHVQELCLRRKYLRDYEERVIKQHYRRYQEGAGAHRQQRQLDDHRTFPAS